MAGWEWVREGRREETRYDLSTGVTQAETLPGTATSVRSRTGAPDLSRGTRRIPPRFPPFPGVQVGIVEVDDFLWTALVPRPTGLSPPPRPSGAAAGGPVT